MKATKDKHRTFRDKLFIIIFGTDTKAGKRFDVVLLCLILLSMVVVMLESVEHYGIKYHHLFLTIEYVLTILFSIEYLLRLWTARKPLGYALSFYGIIDLLSILPTYLALIVTSSQYLMIIRVLRLMRVFRILKIARFMNEADVLWNSIQASRAKIGVFLFAVMNVAVIMGTLMYLIEHGENGFTSIPRSIYWAVVTMTTVGFGDIHPVTPLGQFFSMILMIMGYGVIAVPTGIVGAELMRGSDSKTSEHPPAFTDVHCNNCGLTGHIEGAKYCRHCGAEL